MFEGVHNSAIGGGKHLEEETELDYASLGVCV